MLANKAVLPAGQNIEKEGKLTDKVATGIDWEQLKKQVAPPERGLLAGPLTEGEAKLRQYQANRQGLVDAIHIIVETLPFVHPDWLLDEVSKLGDAELVNIARLQFVQLALTNLGRMNQLQESLIASESKNFADQGINVPTPEGFTLNVVLTELANRLVPPVKR